MVAGGVGSANCEQRYQQVLRELRDPKFYQIGITGMLLRRGYLWPNERDDLNALRQAVMWLAKPGATTTGTRPMSPYGPGAVWDEAIDD
jgi:hypothetical protein